MAGGCGATTETNANANTAPVEVVNANPTGNTNIITIDTTNANSINAANSNRGITNVTAPPMTGAKQMTYPAPDNSEFFTTMDKSGQAIETRVFHNHPQLDKVTRTWKSVNEKTISIYLKNGKVITLPGDKIENINSQPVSVFLDAAGIKPAPAPPATRGKSPAKVDDTKAPQKP